MSDRAAWFHRIITGKDRGVGPTLIRWGLWWLRIPYGIIAWTRNRLFDLKILKSTTAPAPVVSIGNLTLGGTGKTPCVEYVASFFRERGVQVAILSRGYGAEDGRNDEAMVLEENLPDVPHLQGADRAALATTAVEELECEVLVLDDGFQHRRLVRQLNVVLLDATQPVEQAYLFPRGTLRETVRELRRADTLILTRCDQVPADALGQMQSFWRKRCPTKVLASARHEPTELIRADEAPSSVDLLRGRTVGAFCGIGNPAAFQQTLESLGATVTAFRSYPDHHAYTRDDVEDLRHWGKTLPADAWVITTQKDWVKVRLADLNAVPLYALRIGMTFRDGEAEFCQQLENILAMTHE
ncbi:MAG: tetraacyldisaccharide 4'-kinase [Bacteroidales bacterium]|nr:tetraacyldisaccharide 4'-kinase [Bacteroidales bacterium]